MKEIYKDIKGYEGIYQVSNFGNVKSLEREVICRSGSVRTVKERVLKFGVDHGGYFLVCLYQDRKPKTRTVHQLVAVAFLKHKPCGYKLVINHIDFNKQNNHVSNLEIVTQRDSTNQKHIKSASKYTGVTWSKNSEKWMAQIKKNGKLKYLGLFTDELEASNAYQQALKDLKTSAKQGV